MSLFSVNSISVSLTIWWGMRKRTLSEASLLLWFISSVWCFQLCRVPQSPGSHVRAPPHLLWRGMPRSLSEQTLGTSKLHCVLPNAQQPGAYVLIKLSCCFFYFFFLFPQSSPFSSISLLPLFIPFQTDTISRTWCSWSLLLLYLLSGCRQPPARL